MVTRYRMWVVDKARAEIQQKRVGKVITENKVKFMILQLQFFSYSFNEPSTFLIH